MKREEALQYVIEAADDEVLADWARAHLDTWCSEALKEQADILGYYNRE